MDKEKINKVMNSLEGVTYKEWKFISRKVNDYFNIEISKLNDEIKLVNSKRVMGGYKDYSPTT